MYKDDDKKRTYGEEGTFSFESQKPLVIICEGKDDQIFLNYFIKHLEIDNDLGIDDYNIIPVNGLGNLQEFTKKCKEYSNYNYVKSLLFIRDADNDAERAVKSIQNHIATIWNVNLDYIGDFQTDKDNVKIGFFIMPGLNENKIFRNGTLEDLCTDILNIEEKSINSSDIIFQVNNYIKNIENLRTKNFKTPHKNRLHLCFSSTDKFVGSKIGEAAKKGAFNFHSDKLDRLKELILKMS